MKKAKDKYQKTIGSLADDSGTDGAIVMEQARLYACGGELVDHPAVDFFSDLQGKALTCSNYTSSFIPFEMMADTPGSLRYVINYEDVNRRVQSCSYNNGYTLERWQYGAVITVKYVTTGEEFAKKTFYGRQPFSCPYERWFSMQTELEWGGIVEDVDIQVWLSKVLK